jgi:hypothetical protein
VFGSYLSQDTSYPDRFFFFGWLSLAPASKCQDISISPQFLPAHLSSWYSLLYGLDDDHIIKHFPKDGCFSLQHKGMIIAVLDPLHKANAYH